MVAKSRRDFQNKYLDLAILALFPILQVFMNSNWIFNPLKALPSLAFRDTWFYNGIFFYFFEYVNKGFMSTHYFIERLPVNIPGYYLYHVLSPVRANYVLHLSFYYMAVFSVYFILASLLNSRSALVASLAMGSYPWFLRAVGWDYIDGVGIAYFCVSMALLVAATRQTRPSPFLFVAGATTACLVFTNLFWLPFVLVLVTFYAALNFLHQKRSLIRDAVVFAAGGLTITAFFSLFYYFAAGRFVFIENSIRAALGISQDSALTPLLRLMYAAMEPYWLILPVVLFSCAGFLLLVWNRHARFTPRAVGMILFMEFCLMFGFFVFWHVFFQPYLSIFLYMSYLIPSTFLLFGVLISTSLEHLTDGQYRGVILWCILALTAPLALSGPFFKQLQPLQDSLLLLAAASLVLVASLLVRNRFSTVLACAAIAVIGFIGGADANVYVQDRSQARDGFAAVMKAVKAVDKLYPDGRQNLALLYDDSQVDVPGGALQAIYANTPGLGYEQVRPVGWEVITPFNNKDVLLIAQTDEAFRKIQEYVSQYSDTIQLDLKQRIPIQSGDFKFYMFLFHVSFQEYDHLFAGETFEFDRPFAGENFYPFENMQGQSFVWSGPEPEARMDFRLGNVESHANLLVCVDALQPKVLDSLQLYVNNILVPLTKTSEADCPSLFTATIPPAFGDGIETRVTTFAFHIDKTVSPLELGINDDARKLGLRFDWIRIR